MIANQIKSKYHKYMSERGVVHILILILLLAAIVAGIYLSLHPQIFRSRANLENSWVGELNMTDSYGDPINCDTTQDPPVCYSPTDDINVTWKGSQSAKSSK